MFGTIVKHDKAILMATELAKQGIPYSFEPYPFDEYRIEVKSEYQSALVELANQENML
ncbi:hypothetical protein [Alteromonas antoniana]|uniref:hypothetical protein n=1 Tax=Alteromonas antoniana TaxID=2803813 RepID=UPI001C45F7E7|nr:hypothetical protein [Alteromonas antoniana]